MTPRSIRPTRRRLALAAVATVGAAGASAQPAADSAQLVSIMERYAAALRANDVEVLVGLYAANGVFMREHLPASVGRDALRAAYREIFATLKVDLAFTIQEVEASGDMAWLRSTSRGTIRVLASGVESTDSFNALVVFRRESAGWKIRSYLYASERPGTQTPK